MSLCYYVALFLLYNLYMAVQTASSHEYMLLPSPCYPIPRVKDNINALYSKNKKTNYFVYKKISFHLFFICLFKYDEINTRDIFNGCIYKINLKDPKKVIKNNII